MPQQNDNPKVWKYLKTGDILVDSEDSVWGKQKFEITYFHGNAYCPLVSVSFTRRKNNYKPERANLGVREARLVDAPKRPLRKLEDKVITKMMLRGNLEAKREFIMRKNSKIIFRNV